MKKSTLITTIAMIVVVVVALSTATYAWFSAAAVSTATVSMTTTATSDWMIFVGNGTADAQNANLKEYTFTSAAAEAITLTPTPLQSGLYAPASADWENTLSVTGTTASVESQAFLSAKKSGSVSKVSVVPTVYDPYVIKVSNASGATKNLKVTVVINAGVSQTTGTLYAAAATTFDIAYITTKANDTVHQFTKGYTKCATPDSAYTLNVNVDPASASDNADRTNGIVGTAAFAYSSATNMTGTQYTYFTKAGETPTDAEKAWGVTAGQYYLHYSITISSLSSSDSVYLSIYPWIDGWAADNSAGGADYSINFGFTSVD